jgi:hypothetical protein
MEETIKKGKSESWDDYVLRMIEHRSENELEHDELYEILYKEQLSQTEARKRLYGIKTNIIQSREYDNGLPQSVMNKETFEMNVDGSHTVEKLISACEEDLKNPNRLMELHGYDPLEWELMSSRQNKWNVYSKVDGVQTLYSSRLVVKPRIVRLSMDDIQSTLDKLTVKKMNIKDYEYKFSNDEFMFEIPMMDVHFNKFTEKEITGFDSDAQSTKEQFLNVIKDFISRVKGKNITKIVFPIGQDFFNCDNKSGTTTKGTLQDNDLRHDKMFDEGVNLLFDAIEMLREIAPVEIPFVTGNHDEHISFYAVYTLKKLYEKMNITSVTFDTLPKRKYIEFGKCLIGYTHGDKERNRIEKENIMQKEVAEAWGRTMFREWHLGHEHHEEVHEVGGIKYRKISSITANDRWHYESGYGSLRMAQAFLWHKDYGLLDVYNSPVID